MVPEFGEEPKNHGATSPDPFHHVDLPQWQRVVERAARQFADQIRA
jgi:hypothetical protein